MNNNNNIIYLLIIKAETFTFSLTVRVKRQTSKMNNNINLSSEYFSICSLYYHYIIMHLMVPRYTRTRLFIRVRLFRLERGRHRITCKSIRVYSDSR